MSRARTTARHRSERWYRIDTARAARRRVHGRTSDAIEIIDAMLGNSRRRREQADRAFEDAVVGQLVYDARTRARLTQRQLADRIGVNNGVISRLEDADYRGHSLSMLRRIARALGKRIDIRFVDAEAGARPPASVCCRPRGRRTLA